MKVAILKDGSKKSFCETHFNHHIQDVVQSWDADDIDDCWDCNDLYDAYLDELGGCNHDDLS